MKLFGKQKKEQTSNDSELHWINQEDNIWRHNILDLRPLTQSMTSTSTNPLMAANAISFIGEDGTTFFGLKPQNSRIIDVNFNLAIDESLEAGILFTPNTMEHKWAICFDGEYLIFIRSWLREVFVVAKTNQKGNRLFIETI